MKFMSSHLCFIITTLLVTGCATVNPQKDYDHANNMSEARTGHPIIWQQTEDDRLEVEQAVRKLLIGDLTPDKAVRIALMNNRDLQAKFEMLGIARADVVQAGLFTNPSLSALFQFPFASTNGGTSADVDFIFTLSDLWNVPIRKKISANDAQQVTLQIVSEVIQTAAKTKSVYNDYLLQTELKKFTRKNVSLYENDLKTANRHHEAGLVNDIFLYILKNSLYNEQLALARINADIKSTHAKLMRLLGLNPFNENVTINGELPNVKPVRLTKNDAWNYAFKYRIDLKIARLQIQQTQYILKLQKAKVFGDIGLGPGYTRELDRAQKLGPLLSFQLPIFNQNQGGIARAEYQLRQANKHLCADEIMAKEEILQLLNELELQHTHAKLYQDQILNVELKGEAYAKKHVETMKLNNFVLIDARRRKLEAEKGYLMTRYHYNQAKISLESALGMKDF